MPELRICAFHINSNAWRDAYTSGKEALFHMIWFAIADQVDVICGVANLFAQRLCSSDSHSDYNTSCIVNLLEQILKIFNAKRKAMHCITYDIRSSTIETEWVKAQLAFDADCDCMVYIHLNHGKESLTQATRAKEEENRGREGYDGPIRQCESVLKVAEHLKYLEPADLMLKHTDQAFHCPLLVRSVLWAQRNFRNRSIAGQQKKNERDRLKRQRTQQDWHRQEQEEEQYEEIYEEPVRRERSPTPRRAFQLRSVSRTRRDSRSPARRTRPFENYVPAPRTPTKAPPTPPAPPRRTASTREVPWRNPPTPPRSQRDRSPSQQPRTRPVWNESARDRQQQAEMNAIFHRHQQHEEGDYDHWQSYNPRGHSQQQYHWGPRGHRPPAFQPSARPIGMAPSHWEPPQQQRHSQPSRPQRFPTPRWGGYPPRGSRGYNPFF